MTSNQINYLNAETRKEELDETKRHNRKGEAIQAGVGGATAGAKLVSSPISALIKAANDPSWYNLNPQLVKDVANFSYNKPLGAPSGLPNHGARFSVKGRVPGIMTIKWIPGIGDGTYESSPINVAAKNIYSYVRYLNSGRINYDAPDLMMYLLAMDSIYSLYAVMTRLYSVINKADSYNWFYPKAIVEALGFDYQDMLLNISQLRAYINNFVQRVSVLSVPTGIALYQRHIWLNLNIFKDAGIKRAQNYAFKQEYFFKYDDVNGQLNPTQPELFQNENKTKIKFSTLVTFADDMLSAVMASEDIGIMSGDILKAYGAEKLFKLDKVSEDLILEPVFSEEVLTQINSAVLVGNVDPTNYKTWTIHQVKSGPRAGLIYQGYILPDNPSATDIDNAKPQAHFAKIGPNEVKFSNWIGSQEEYESFTNSAVIQSYKDEVTPDDNMVATRLACNFSVKSKGFADAHVKLTNWGTEVCTIGTIYTYSEGSKAISSYEFSTLTFLCLTGVVTDPNTKKDMVVNQIDALITLANFNANIVDQYSKFDWAPIIYLDFLQFNNDPSINEGNVYASTMITDIGNYYVINGEQLNSVHSVALQSLFGIPLLGANTRR